MKLADKIISDLDILKKNYDTVENTNEYIKGRKEMLGTLVTMVKGLKTEHYLENKKKKEKPCRWTNTCPIKAPTTPQVTISLDEYNKLKDKVTKLESDLSKVRACYKKLATGMSSFKNIVFDGS